MRTEGLDFAGGEAHPAVADRDGSIQEVRVQPPESLFESRHLENLHAGSPQAFQAVLLRDEKWRLAGRVEHARDPPLQRDHAAGPLLRFPSATGLQRDVKKAAGGLETLGFRLRKDDLLRVLVSTRLPAEAGRKDGSSGIRENRPDIEGRGGRDTARRRGKCQLHQLPVTLIERRHSERSSSYQITDVSPSSSTLRRIVRLRSVHDTWESSKRRTLPRAPQVTGAMASLTASTTPACRKSAIVLAPPSIMTCDTPRAPRSSMIESALISSSGNRTTVARGPSRRSSAGSARAPQNTSFCPLPSVKNFASGGKPPVRVIVALIGWDGTPR